MIAIIDTGGANHASIQNALARLSCTSVVTVDPVIIGSASHVILPGVGHARFAMEKLKAAEITGLITSQKKPVLGICLGMQIMFAHSEEGPADCLGIFPGTVKKLVASGDFRVPHMGWNQIEVSKEQTSRLLDGISLENYFYFVHSFAAPHCEWISHSTGQAGSAPVIPAVLECKNFFATQFHPERSGLAGAQLLKNFIGLTNEET
jgi:glutamine amidotransferase